MIHITLLAVGKCRQLHFRNAAQDYAQRLKHYAVYSEIEVKETRAAGHVPINSVLHQEGERLIQALPKGSYAIALHPAGQTSTSEALSKRLSTLTGQGKNHLTFMLGGAFGLSEDVLAQANWCLSLSAMTFPHELARVILLEQLYRVFTIMRGESYHK